MLKEIVYAGEEPFNVPLQYYKSIKESTLNYGITSKTSNE